MLGNILSWVFSTLSNIVWLFVFIPQILENRRNRSSDAVSFYLILLWYIGDTFSAISAIYKSVPLMLIYVGIYHIVFDLIFIGQVIYYRLPYYDSPLTLPLLSSPDISTRSTWNYLMNILYTEEVLVFFGYNIILLISQVFLQYIPSIIVGNIFAWSATSIFLISRLPQIILNKKRESVQGLSFVTFINITIANILFLISILIYLLDTDSQTKYLLNNLPWIVGSSGTIFFDIIIFVQFMKYR